MPLYIAGMNSGVVVLKIVLGRDGGGTPTCLGGLVVVSAFATASFFVFVSRGYLVHRIHHYIFSAGVRGDVHFFRIVERAMLGWLKPVYVGV